SGNQTAAGEGVRLFLVVYIHVAEEVLGTADSLEEISVLGMGRRKGVLFFDGVTGYYTLAPARQNGAVSTSELDKKATLETPCVPQEVQP
ncbi:hypothetical protein XENOCAPTIV_020603, partial [Xenoophorus captivus]